MTETYILSIIFSVSALLISLSLKSPEKYLSLYNKIFNTHTAIFLVVFLYSVGGDFMWYLIYSYIAQKDIIHATEIKNSFFPQTWQIALFGGCGYILIFACENIARTISKSAKKDQ